MQPIISFVYMLAKFLCGLFLHDVDNRFLCFLTGFYAKDKNFEGPLMMRKCKGITTYCRRKYSRSNARMIAAILNSF